MLRVMDDFEIRALQSEALRHEREKWFIAAKHQREQKELHADREEQELIDLLTSVVLADAIEVEEFKVELDTYDALTIEALTENQFILDQLYLERDTMLDSAYQLENGTRVFKSEDGVRVFDESGDLVSDNVIHPDEIGDHYPKAEPYLEKLEFIEKHEAIQQDLFDYQEKLDDARERLDSDDLAQEEFEAIREEIQNEMPLEVRRKLPDYDPSQETDLTSEFAATATIEQATKLTPADMAIDPSIMPGMK